MIDKLVVSLVDQYKYTQMRWFTLLFLSLLSCQQKYANAFHAGKTSPGILVFSKTVEFRHESIYDGKIALLQMGKENGWLVDTTENASLFNDVSLSQYKVVVFLNTTGDILDGAQKVAFQNYIRKGGSFVGIHSATDTEKNWPWYNNLVGAYFKDHPKPQNATYHVVRKSHPSVLFMPDSLRRFEEIYNFRSFKKDLVNTIITVDEKTYTGGNMPDFHPISWFHVYEGGKVFYTAWGHHPETFREEIFLKHILGGIKWALGLT